MRNLFILSVLILCSCVDNNTPSELTYSYEFETYTVISSSPAVLPDYPVQSVYYTKKYNISKSEVDKFISDSTKHDTTYINDEKLGNIIIVNNKKVTLRRI